MIILIIILSGILFAFHESTKDAIQLNQTILRRWNNRKFWAFWLIDFKPMKAIPEYFAMVFGNIYHLSRELELINIAIGFYFFCKDIQYWISFGPWLVLFGGAYWIAYEGTRLFLYRQNYNALWLTLTKQGYSFLNKKIMKKLSDPPDIDPPDNPPPKPGDNG